MKKDVYVLLFSLFAFYFSTAQQAIEVPQTQNSILTKKTAQWCPPCGGWAWNFYEDMITEDPANVLLMTAQIPGGSSSASIKIETETSGAITNNFGSGSSRPLIYLNNDNQGVLSQNVSAKKADILTKISDYAAQIPVVQTGLKAEFTPTELVISTSSKFFQPANGNYSLGIYSITKSIVADQAGQSGNSGEHKNVIGDELTGKPFGNIFVTGEIVEGREIAGQISVPLAELPELNNLVVATIIWEEKDGDYTMINTNFTDVFEEFKEQEMQDTTTTSIFRSIVPKSLRVYPTQLLNNGDLTVEFDLKHNTNDVSVDLYSISGQQLENIYQGTLVAGKQQFNWQPNAQFVAGIYVLKIAIEDQLITQQIILE